MRRRTVRVDPDGQGADDVLSHSRPMARHCARTRLSRAAVVSGLGGGNLVVKWLAADRGPGRRPSKARGNLEILTDTLADGAPAANDMGDGTRKSVINRPSPQSASPAWRGPLRDHGAGDWVGARCDTAWMSPRMAGPRGRQRCTGAAGVTPMALTAFIWMCRWDGQRCCCNPREWIDHGYVQPTKTQLARCAGAATLFTTNNGIQTWLAAQGRER